jgi:two-component system, NtrC family, response regulator HydG
MMPRKIVVVEDDAPFCYALRKALAQAGYEVESYTGSADAWSAVGASGEFDLLLTDLVFPQGQPNGIALARSTRYHHPQLPVIYMTAYLWGAEHAKAEDGPVFVKPVDLDALIQTIGELLGPNPARTA